MQMTCEWLECIRMTGEVYILTSVIYPEGTPQHLLCRGLASS